MASGTSRSRIPFDKRPRRRPVLTLTNVYSVPVLPAIDSPPRIVSAVIEPPQPRRFDRAFFDSEILIHGSASRPDSAPRTPLLPRHITRLASRRPDICLSSRSRMRTRTWCVAAALVCLSRLAAAQTVLSEADALARLINRQPARSRDPGSGRCRARRRPCCRPMAESSCDVQPRIGGGRHREHVPGDAAASSDRATRSRHECRVRAGRSQRAASRGRHSAGSRGAAERVCRSRVGAGTRSRNSRVARPDARPGRDPRAPRGGRRGRRLRPPSSGARSDGYGGRLGRGTSRPCASPVRVGGVLRSFS